MNYTTARGGLAVCKCEIQ